ncbi:branched-subunit amino acid transport protein [Scopulibacillus darangshiensis]|uniref:Branched-subunit amino acid transport protein n=1 Tax=Scopulibacillus darangshiensis TaxID=442528 RepID=A0A4R2P4H6_9BACL|nr:AzlD domain-containing protein [Scopulibacillus darangshiensis]TCP28841.1 branched-subunit amino acid transport protein [Scopulibacillus darangshiensis]
MFNQWLLIGLLSISTYISRIIGVEVMAEREMSTALRLYFNYVPVAIISALIIKQILVPTGGHLIISLPVLIGCLSTAISIKLIKMFLPAVVIGAIIGLLVRNFWG